MNLHSLVLNYSISRCSHHISSQQVKVKPKSDLWHLLTSYLSSIIYMKWFIWSIVQVLLKRIKLI